jgi:formyltetrahydrofolate-dependent phosphoribosylglycinamide formyltransferase
MVLYTDGGSRGNPGPAAAGIVLEDAQGQVLLSRGFHLGHTTNNVAEYTGITEALKAARTLGASQIELFSDSELLVKQLNGLYAVRSPKLKPLHREARVLLQHFDRWEITHVLRHKNTHADRLVNLALDRGEDVTETQKSPQPTTPALRIGALISGGGRTLLNLLDCHTRGELNIEVPLVISSRSKVAGVERAQKAGLSVEIVRKRDFADIEAFSRRLEERLTQAGVDLVIQAGWLCLWKIPAVFENRVMNIHPALLPAFGGQGMWGHHVHEAVLAAGCKVSGCTVHFCTDEYDSGPIIVQRCCPVQEDDDADRLAARVFEQECLALPEAVRLFAENRLQVRDGRVLIGVAV